MLILFRGFGKILTLFWKLLVDILVAKPLRLLIEGSNEMTSILFVWMEQLYIVYNPMFAPISQKIISEDLYFLKSSIHLRVSGSFDK